MNEVSLAPRGVQNGHGSSEVGNAPRVTKKDRAPINEKGNGQIGFSSNNRNEDLSKTNKSRKDSVGKTYDASPLAVARRDVGNSDSMNAPQKRPPVDVLLVNPDPSPASNGSAFNVDSSRVGTYELEDLGKPNEGTGHAAEVYDFNLGLPHGKRNSRADSIATERPKWVGPPGITKLKAEKFRMVGLILQ
jgi:hypothetical protein